MKLNFWAATLLAVVGAWYAFAFAGPRQVLIEVLPEELADGMADLSSRAAAANEKGTPLTKAQVAEIVRHWNAASFGKEYDIRLLDVEGRWMLSAMPQDFRRDVTTVWDRVLLLRTRVEHWPMYKVSQQMPVVVTDGGPALAESIAKLETSSIRVERRILRADAVSGATLAMRASH